MRSVFPAAWNGENLGSSAMTMWDEEESEGEAVIVIINRTKSRWLVFLQGYGLTAIPFWPLIVTKLNMYRIMIILVICM